MEKTKVEPGTVIGNANILDLRRTTAETVANISRIDNVNILLYSRATAPLIPTLHLGNVNASLEVPEDAQIVTGQVTIGPEYMQGREQPVYLVVTGQVIIKPDVAGEDVEKGLGGLAVIGQIICPESLLGVVQAKTSRLVGQTLAYPTSGRLITGTLVMDETFLRSLADESDLVIIGSLRLPQVVPTDLLEKKLGRLHVGGSIRVHEENAEAIQARLSNGSAKMRVIPDGFALVENPLVLDDIMLEALPAPKLFCLERVSVDTATSPSVLDERLDWIEAKDLLLCPAPFKGIMSRKCNFLETQAIVYEGELWLVDSEETLSMSRFDYLSGKATLVVTGMLTIEEDVEPRVLADRLAKVHNEGVIECTAQQRGALQARLGLNVGVLEVVEEKEPEEGARQITNVNHLAL